MREVQGQPLPLGINISGDHVNFSVAVPEGERCWLLLYRAGEEEPKERYEMTEAIGEVRFLALEGMDRSPSASGGWSKTAASSSTWASPYMKRWPAFFW